MKGSSIKKICAREIIDSRANPTLEVCVTLEDGTCGVASVPSGASRGKYEALELRDGDDRFGGLGVRNAVANVNTKISPLLSGVNATCMSEIDMMMREYDGTKNKSSLGANSILAVSIACAKAAANYCHMPLYRYLGGALSYRLPVPMMNVLNGGAHAKNNIDIQEFMLVPLGAVCFSEGVRLGCEIYKKLKEILEKEGLSTSVGDEGGFAPNIKSDESALMYITNAIEECGYTDEVKIALDIASSEWYSDGVYTLTKRKTTMTSVELINYYRELCSKYPICSIEDGLGEDDDGGWIELTRALGNRIMLVGDDYFVTDKERLLRGINNKAANSILIKPNQIGSLSETFDAINTAKDAGYVFIPSHRSGETEDTALADIAVASGAKFIKSGAPSRSERLAKYNRLLRIEGSLGICSKYGPSL